MASRSTSTGTQHVGHRDGPQYEELLSSVDAVIWEADARTLRFTFVSQHAERLLGYPPEDWLAPGFWSAHVHPDDHDCAAEFYRGATREPRTHELCTQEVRTRELEYRLIAADGRVVWVRDIVRVFPRGDDDTVLRGIMVDVTEQRRTTATLRESEGFYRLLTESGSDFIRLHDFDGRSVYGSPSVDQLYPHHPTHLFEFAHPEDVETGWRWWEHVVSGGHELLYWRVIDRDGRWRWIETRGSIVRYHGEPHVLTVCRDITDRKQAEDERQAHLWFLEGMDRVNRAVQGTNDVEQMLRDVLDVVLTIFGADRSWLLSPCDPDAAAWSVVLDRTRPDAAGTRTPAAGPMTPDLANVLRIARDSGAPVQIGPGSAHPLPVQAETLGIRAALVMAVRATMGESYLFGVNLSSATRVWSHQEERLLEEIGRRLADALGILLTVRRLAESEAKLDEAQRIAHVGHWENDLDVDRLTWSDETYRIVGLEPREGALTVADFRTRIHPDDRDLQAEAAARLQRGEGPYDIEYRIVRPDGEVRTIQSIGDVIRGPSGRPRRTFGVMQDITDRRRTEKALTLFRSLIDNTHDAIEVIDPESGAFLDVNRRACIVHGYTRDEYLGLRMPDVDPVIAQQTWEAARQTMQDTESSVFESQHRRKDGSVFPVEVTLTSVRLDREYFIAVVRDITERKRAEHALTESHGLLRAIVEGTPDVVFVKDLEGRYLLINSAGARYLGKTEAEVIGKTYRELAPDGADAIDAHNHQVIASGESQTFEERVTVAGVTRTFVATKSPYRDAHGGTIGLIGISSEVTDLKRLEAQLRQAQKMEAVGQLAGGVAHDFNNLLTIITGYGAMVRAQLPAGDQAYEDIEQVLAAAQRAGGLTRQLLAFSRRQMLQPQVTNLGQSVTTVAGMLRRVIGEDITLQTELAPNAWPVHADPGQLEQVVMNLAVNARDAMPNGGTLRLRTANVEIDRAAARQRPGLIPGPYAVLTVEDTGTGIDPDVLPRLFEPFFTTKGPGRGTGLGLATVYGIVKQSAGFIYVDSTPGQGSRFSIYLPRYEGPTAGAAMLEPPAPPRGTETILLVEDEASVRMAVRHMLERQGYRILEASDGAEALRRVTAAEARGERIDLVLTDVIMPEQSGCALGESLAAHWPRLRVLYMSGYADDEILRRGLAVPGAAFLEKPFTPDRLGEFVRRALGKPSPA